jgi:ABC-type dipeptide/oligopeptide/nickel transport system permease subunit
VNGIWKGTVLGVLNVFVIALGMAAYEGGPAMMFLVTVFGILPGVIAGAALGGLAHVTDSLSRPLRVAILTLPAIGVVYVLARQFRLDELAYICSMPTAIVAVMLERWTYKPADPPPVPTARVMT